MKCGICSNRDGVEVWKVTRKDWTTRGNTLWGPGVEHVASGGHMCTAEVIHGYSSALMASLMSPMHLGWFGVGAVLWRGEGDICVDDGTRVGCSRLRTVEIVDMPVIGLGERVGFGILAASRLGGSGETPIWREFVERWERDKVVSNAGEVAEWFGCGTPCGLAALGLHLFQSGMCSPVPWVVAQTIWESVDKANMSGVGVPDIGKWLETYLTVMG